MQSTTSTSNITSDSALDAHDTHVAAAPLPCGIEHVRAILRERKDDAGVSPALDDDTFSLCGVQVTTPAALERVLDTLTDEPWLITRRDAGVYTLQPLEMHGGVHAKGSARSRGVKRRVNTWNSYTTYKSREIRHSGKIPPHRWSSDPSIKQEYNVWKKDPDKHRALVLMSQMSKLGKLPEQHVPLEDIEGLAEKMNLAHLTKQCGMQVYDDEEDASVVGD